MSNVIQFCDIGYNYCLYHCICMYILFACIHRIEQFYYAIIFVKYIFAFCFENTLIEHALLSIVIFISHVLMHINYF